MIQGKPVRRNLAFTRFLIAFYIAIIALQALSAGIAGGQEGAQSAVLLDSAERAFDGPYIVRSQFWVADDVASLEGVWLAGLATSDGAPPDALSVTWAQSSSGWFGEIWALHITSSRGLLPNVLNPTVGAGFLEGAQAVQLAHAQPRPGRLYETILSYDPETGIAGVRFVDRTTNQLIVERGVQLAPYNKEALVPAAGLIRTPSEAPAPEGSRFEAFDYERGFLPVGIGWDILQHNPAEEVWSRPRALDRRLQTKADVSLPWDALPGRLRLRLDGDAVALLAEVEANARKLSLPFEIAHLPGGEHRLALEYQSEYGAWDVLVQPLSVGRLDLRFEELDLVVKEGGGAFIADVSGTLVFEGDGPMPEAVLSLHADVATFDRDYWFAGITGGSLGGITERSGLQMVTTARDVTLLDNVAIDLSAGSRSVRFAATLPLDGTPPPPGGGWTVMLRPELETSVSNTVPSSVSVWSREGAGAASLPGEEPTPDSPLQDQQRIELTAMVYNIRHGRGMDDKVDLERIADVIRSARADIVGLNEVDRITARTDGVDQAATLARLLDMNLAYGANINFQGGHYGNAILSRFPITSATNVALPSGSEQRGLLHATLDVAGMEVHFLTTHLGLSAAERDRQLESIARYIAGLDGPVILGGDFNQEFVAERALGAGLRDAWRLQMDEDRIRTPSSGLTIPSTRPSRRIDYIFISSDVQLRGDDPVRTISTTASDHLPVVAEIELTR